MNNTQLDPGLSAMLDGTNFPIDPGALLHQQPIFETDNLSSRTTSTSSVPRLSTPDTDPDDFNDFNEEEEEEVEDYFTSKKPNTRSKAKNTNKMPPSKSKTTTPSKSKRAGGGTTTNGGTTTATTTTTTASTTTKSGGAAEKRRKRNLERNRAAASKCRQRKKQWQDGLERRKMELESRYKALHVETKELLEEVAQLKNFVMAHAACNDANIDDWIRNEADSFVRRMSTANLHGQPPGGNVVPHSHHAPSGNPPMNEAMSNMFPPPGQKAPFDPNGRPGVADNGSNNIFNQDVLMVS